MQYKKYYKILLMDDIPEYIDTMGLNRPDDSLALASYLVADTKAVVRDDPSDMAIIEVLMSKTHIGNHEGFELLTSIKANKPEKSVIMICGYRKFEFKIGPLILGTEFFPLKPIKQNTFRVGVERTLQAREGHL